MNVYIYGVDIYCEQCGEAIRKQIIDEGHAPDYPDDEDNYDSGNFPKGPYPGGGGESDSPQHCGSGPGCINAIKLSNGTKVGAWLENKLTAEGVDYVREAIHESGGSVIDLWADFYSDYDLELKGD